MTGHSGRCQHCGFTLIEILVVVAIIGILAAVVQFAFSGGGSRQALGSSAETCALRIELARAQALQRNREWGVRVRLDGYEFLEFDPETQLWQGVADKVFAAVTLASGITLELASEGFDRKALKAALSADAGIDTDEVDLKSKRTTDDDRQAEAVLPDILLLSSGEATPFTLRFIPAGEGVAWVVGTDGLQRARASLEPDDE